MALPILLLTLVMITIGAELLVRGATSLALRLGVSPLFVGLTVVGFGTSSPELAASLVATLRGSSDVSVGNVVGSNIFNIGVIVGISAIVQPIRVKFAAVRRDLVVAVAAAAVPWLGLAFGSSVSRVSGIALVMFLATYIVLSYRSARTEVDVSSDLMAGEIRSSLAPAPGKSSSVWVQAALLIGGLALLVLGARLFVSAAIDIARALGVSELIIGLTVVSVGTSLPELVTSLVAAIRRSPDIAIGNIIGSNIFNSFGILGTCAIVHPQTISRPVALIDTPVMLVLTLALAPLLKSDGRISRVEGGLLLGAYGLYGAGICLRSL